MDEVKIYEDNDMSDVVGGGGAKTKWLFFRLESSTSNDDHFHGRDRKKNTPNNSV